MIGWILATVLTLAIAAVVGVFIFRSVITEFRSKNGDAHEIVQAVAHVDILPADVKENLAKTEATVYRKADEVVRMANRETGIVRKSPATEVKRDPLEETSFMKAISDKVERVKKLSED